MTLSGVDRKERYVESAVTAEIETLASTQTSRNAALNKASFALGQFVGAGALSEERAVDLLVRACDSNGYAREDGRAAVRSSIKSGLNAGMRSPRERLPREMPSKDRSFGEARPDLDRATLQGLADRLKLSVDALAFYGLRDGHGCVEVPYYNLDGTVHRVKHRRYVQSPAESWWGPGPKQQIAYSPDRCELARAQRFVMLPEGETDTLTLLFAGVPAIGLPGAGAAAALQADHVQGLEQVFVVRENESNPKPGETFVAGCRQRLAELGFKGAVHEVRMPDGAKDPAALWQRDPAAFSNKLASALEAAKSPPATPRPAYQTISEMVITALKPVGQRLRTGFGTLDDATRGGIPLGRVVVLAGAPGAAKTGVSTFLVDRWERAGCAVVYLASDEPAEGILTRFGQLDGCSREGLELEGDLGDSTRAGFAARVTGRLMSVIDPDANESMCTIEDAERALVHLAAGGPRVLVVDSLQTARCAGAQLAESARERIDAKLAVIKAIAKRGTMVLAISEMSRAGYRSGARSENISALAAGKESGSIEYGAALLLGLRSVPGETGMVDVEVAKNRLGGSKPEFRLRLDFDRASFEEVKLPPAEDRQQQASSQRRTEVHQKLRGALLQYPDGLKSKNQLIIAAQVRKADGFRAIDEMELAKEISKTPEGVYRLGADVGGRGDAE